MHYMPNTGNLLRNTRRLHPSESRTPWPGRYGRISGGVLLSFPGQNGQKDVPLSAALSRRKSLGRLERSVEMMTQRPVMGSFLSSGTSSILSHPKRILKKDDVRIAARFQVDADDVEAAGRVIVGLAQKRPSHFR